MEGGGELFCNIQMNRAGKFVCMKEAESGIGWSGRNFMQSDNVIFDQKNNKKRLNVKTY